MNAEFDSFAWKAFQDKTDPVNSNMKLKTTSLTSLSIAAALFASMGNSNAATVFQIDFQMAGSPAGQESESGWTAWDVTKQDTALESINSTVGGISVTITALGGTSAYVTSRGGTADARGGEITGTSWDNMVEDFIAARDGNGDMSIALTGLNAGFTYTLTGWHNDSYTINQGFSANLGYAITPSMQLGTLVGVADAGASTNLTAGARSDGQFNTSVISFTSDVNGNATILLTGNSTSNFLALSGLQLTAVPEPSAALLGGLGVLALLRRRRA